ncbi:MarR family winged helix-turn-helix transcriptional regulator [Zoogloea sp. LCSB751]|uniref:MarR family winged helix-turn-helix transcriptional regulator n=1 Tax=Zoogloea sp. LCSB751 TaxID=1965277 RepID=UPI00156EEBB9|nr:MarR family transcriptional regulator [Zoogloea sp. LCSB751]
MSNDRAKDVFEAVHTVMHLFRSKQYRALRESPLQLTHMEGKVLGFFARNPGETLSTLVSHSGRDKGQLARLTSSLRERGLLEARPDANDRRNLRLYLTPEGEAVSASLDEQERELSQQAIQDLSQAEQDALLSLLQRVRKNLDAAP